MTLALGSVLLSLLNLASAALLAERRRLGWLVALSAQLPWTWYDVWTRQFGFLMLTIFYVPVYVRGWRKAPEPAHPASSTDVLAPSAKTADTIGNETVVVSAEPMNLEMPDAYVAPNDHPLRQGSTRAPGRSRRSAEPSLHGRG